jgi:GPH family glycoside/pentoside/hexuronide:cation symporter
MKCLFTSLSNNSIRFNKIKITYKNEKMSEPESKIESTGLDRGYTPPPLKKIIALAAGATFTQAMFLAAFRIQLFALKALGLAAILVALFMAIFSIIDIINEYIVGYLSDKATKFTKRWGKRFVFIIGGTIGTALTLLLVFLPIWETKPGGGLAHPEQTLIVILWLSIAVSIWDTIQTTEELNTRAVVPDLIRDNQSRARLEIIGTTFGTFGLIIGIILIPLSISIFGGETNPNAYFMMAIVMAILYIALLPIRAYGIWEPKEMREFRYEFDQIKKEKVPLWDAAKKALKSRNWMAFVITYFQYGLITRIITLGYDLYVVDVLGLDIAYAALPLLGVVAGSFVFGVFSYLLLRKYGAKTTYLVGICIATLGFFMMIFSDSILTLTLFSLIAGMGIGAQVTSRGMMSSQAIDFDTLKYGKREEAQYFAVFQIFSATTKTWAAVLFAIIVAIFLYDPLKGTENTEFAKFGLVVYLSIIPMIVTIISGILVWKLFNISKELADENKEKLLKLGH